MNMNALPLKRCPFCGGKAVCTEEETDIPIKTGYLYIFCESCGIRTPKQLYSLNDEEISNALLRAMKLWNRRCNDGDNS